MKLNAPKQPTHPNLSNFTLKLSKNVLMYKVAAKLSTKLMAKDIATVVDGIKRSNKRFKTVCMLLELYCCGCNYLYRTWKHKR